MIDAHKGWPEGECTTTRFFDGIDRWRTANPPPGRRVRAAARLQLVACHACQCGEPVRRRPEIFSDWLVLAVAFGLASLAPSRRAPTRLSMSMTCPSGSGSMTGHPQELRVSAGYGLFGSR